MVTVHVLVGQCGNQLGTAILDALADEAHASDSDAYEMLVRSQHFRPASHKRSTPRDDCAGACVQPRCVMVDMEPKVIEQAMARARGACASDEDDDCGVAVASSPHVPRYTLAPQQCVTRDEGSGNNWAYGYGHQGHSRCEAIAECLRRESERADATVTTYHVVHAVAGGTGAGVGSLVAELVKDAYPHASLLHTLVWPFAAGEVVTQWYNLVLSLHTLRDSVDGALVVYNDEVRDALLRQHACRGLRGKGIVSYARINACMSRLVTPLHVPQLLCTPPSSPSTTAATSAARQSMLSSSSSSTMHRDALSTTMTRRTSRHGTDGSAGDDDDTFCGSQRYARLTDVLEPLCLDPCTKFFTAAAVPSLCSSSSSIITNSSSSSGGDRATTPTVRSVAELTTWHGVLHDAVRLARDRFVVTNCTSASQLYTRSDNTTAAAAAAVGGGVASCCSVRLLQPCCVWALRGAKASSAGVRELHDLAVAHYNVDTNTTFPLSSPLLVSPPHSCTSSSSSEEDAAAAYAPHADCEVTLYGPTREMGQQLAYALHRAEELLSVGAFVHHFERYGVGKSELRDAVTALWDTVAAYDTGALAQ